MNVLPLKQRGVSVTSWVLIITIALFFAILAMRMVPSYLEFYTIRSVLETMSQDPTLKRAEPAKVRQTLDKFMNINSVYSYDPKNFKITKSKGGILVVAEYEVRKDLVGNVAVVMSFREEVQF